MSDIFDVVANPGQGLDVGGVGPNEHVSGFDYGAFDNEDNTLDISNGESPTSLTGANPTIFFSVDRAAVGASGTAVFEQAALNQAAADRFQSTALMSPLEAFNNGTPSTATGNTLSLNQTFYNLQPSISELAVNSTSVQDNVDSLEVTEFKLSGGNRNRNIYFTMDASSPTLDNGSWVTSDILVTLVGSNEPATFAGFASMGLTFDDAIDGLAVWDTNDNGIADAGDYALLSLTSDSDFITSEGLSGADILVTDFGGTAPKMYLSHSQIGLLSSDELDALDIVGTAAVPEPASLGLFAAAAALGLGRLRRRA